MSKQPMVVKSGRFGPYVTDGETNATLRSGDNPETITAERAAELLADKRARGPATRQDREARAGEARAGEEDRRSQDRRQEGTREGPGQEGHREDSGLIPDSWSGARGRAKGRRDDLGGP